MDKLTSPVWPIPPFYKPNEDLDLDKVGIYIDYLLRNGVTNFCTTAGSSQFNLLHNNEIQALNEYIDKKVGSHSKFIIGLPILSSDEISEWIDYKQDYNRAYLVIYPDRYYSGEEIKKYFFRIADHSNIKVWPHGLHIRNGIGGGYRDWNASLVNDLAEHCNINGMKEETSTLEGCRKLCRDVMAKNPNFSIIVAGGSQRRKNYVHPYADVTFLAGIGSFYPMFDLFQPSLLEEDDFFQISDKIGWHLTMREAIGIVLGFDPGCRSPFPRASKLKIAMIDSALRKLGKSI